jgi:hypothetical protein
MEIQPVILTMPERQGAHVADLCAAIAGRPGLADPLIWCDERHEGAAVATRNALSAAATSGRHVLLLEDDVVVDDEAPELIVAAEFPDGVAVISFCDMRELPEFAPRGLYRRSPLGSDGRGWWGNQALLIHRETVAMLTSADWFSHRVETSWGIRAHKATYGDDGRNCSDIRLALLIHYHGGDRSDYAVHVPSLVKHVGYVSVCFPGRTMGERETRNWIADRRKFGVDTVLSRDEAVAPAAGQLEPVG